MLKNIIFFASPCSILPEMQMKKTPCKLVTPLDGDITPFHSFDQIVFPQKMPEVFMGSDFYLFIYF